MRRVIALCVVALVAGCGGGSATKKKADAGKDAITTTDVGGTLDHVEDAPAVEAADDTTPDEGSTGTDAPPDMGTTTGDASPEAAGDGAADAGAAADASDAGDAATAKMVTVVFTGEVVTVARKNGTGLPLGFDATVRTAAVAGSFSYDPTMFDLTLAATRGKYESMPGRTSFTFTVKGKTVTGSVHEQLQTENDLPSDTFRFIDGPQLGDSTLRTMKLDGVDAPMLKLFIAISDTAGAMLSSDKLPDPFPTIDITKIAHTFSLEDEGGTLLMQLDTLVNKGSVDAGTDAGPDTATDGDAAAD